MSKVFAHAGLRVQGAGEALGGGLEKALAAMPGVKRMMAYWYHFVIMFEALFILTSSKPARASPASSSRKPWPRSIRNHARQQAPWGVNVT